MIRKSMIVIVLMIYISTFSYAVKSKDGNQIDSFTAITIKGKEKKFSKVRAVSTACKSNKEEKVIGKASNDRDIKQTRCDKMDIKDTNKVPLEVGTTFGIGFIVPKIRRKDKVTFDLEIVLPEKVDTKNGKTNIITAYFPFTKVDSYSFHSLGWVFSKDEEQQYYIEGKWILKIYNNGNLLAVQEFMLVNYP